MRKSLITAPVGAFIAAVVLVVGAAIGAPVTATAVGAPVTPSASPSGSDPEGDAVVRTADGPVRGVVTADHRIFQGIPYAQPPVGDLRLRAPRPVRPWKRVRDATTAGAWCAQSFVHPPGTPVQVVGDEDCLYLNIHVPRGHGARLPVMVFLHGGNSGSGGAYDPRPVTGPGGVIVVTINYRLGALGFLDHAALRDPFVGNFGIADQQAALRWVRRSIAAFGGDRRNVTLWGESAGGFSVCAQLASPLAAGLFDKAIVQSAPCGNDLVARPEAQRRGLRAVADLGCAQAGDVATCLRAIPTRQLAMLPNDVSLRRNIAAAIPWFPTAGTPSLPDQPMDAARAGRVSPVPMIHGGTRDEMRSFIAERFDGAGAPVTAEQYPRIVHELYGHDAGPVLARYPLTAYRSPVLALATLLTDEGGMVGACSQLPFADAHARQAPTWAYEFAEESTRVVGDLPYGAHHGIDIPYFFDSYLPGASPPPTDAQRELADALIERWTTFARTGRPGPDWVGYRDGHALSFSAARTGPVDVDREHGCAFWRSVTPEAA